MNPYFYFLGYPFNPASDTYFEELPSAIKVTGKLKKIMKSNYNSSTLEEFTSMTVEALFSYYETVDTSTCLTIDFTHEDVDMQRQQEFMEKLYILAKKSHKKGIHRFTLAYLPPYNDALDEYFTEHNSRRHPKWVSSLFSDSVDDMISHNNLVSAMTSSEDILNLLNGIELTSPEKDSFRKIESYQDKSNPASPLSSLFIVKAICYARNKETYPKAVKLLWILARKDSSVELLTSFYQDYKHIFSESLFPYLNLHNLNSMAAKLVFKKEDLEKEKLFDFAEQVVYLAGELPNIENIFLLRKLINDESNFPSVYSLLLNVQSKIKSLSDSIINTPHLPESIYKDVKSMPIIDLNLANNESGILINDIQGIVEGYVDLDMLVTYLIEEQPFMSIGNNLNTLNEEALHLGKKPLDNLDRLQEISLEVEQFEGVLERKSAKVVRLFSSPCIELSKRITDFNVQSIDATGETTAEQLSLAKKDLIVSKKEVATLRGELHQKEKLINTLKTNQRPSFNSCDGIRISDVQGVLNSPSIDGVIRLINKENKTITLSQKAKNELPKLTLFTKFDLLLQKLGILSSPSFIETYSNKGSSACFSMLTNKELAFQESKTVKSRNERSFKFPDGKTRDCKAHLKICSSTKEQYQLRIYFKIEDNHLFIGMITKHLDCAQ